MPKITYVNDFDEQVPTYLAVPSRSGPWPGAVVVQDVLGMTADLRRTTDRLAENGYLALAPDLYGRGPKITCMISTIKAAAVGRGSAHGALIAARDHLLADERCTGKVGLVGFCMGAQFVVQLSPGGLFDASSPNYGVLPRDLEPLKDSCPVVASFGAKDRLVGRGSAARLESALASGDVPRDIKEYPNVGQSFMNDWQLPPAMRMIERAVGLSYFAEESEDAWKRMINFLEAHLS
ncbi:carboxymethylenebutenolidase [Mycobacterium sp. MAA66]|uniref:dienelactone hydrolase family protein n=1 Tax=Mycobacterium sp. MAA66 TaxID=3156297 RepID=UPI0035151751